MGARGMTQTKNVFVGWRRRIGSLRTSARFASQTLNLEVFRQFALGGITSAKTARAFALFARRARFTSPMANAFAASLLRIGSQKSNVSGVQMILLYDFRWC